MNKILAVIPARGGSKGIPKKNLFPLGDKPLIYYTIRAALGSKLITDIIVSTDNDEIKEISESYGIKVPFLRPCSLATDSALAIPTIQHATREMERLKNKIYDYVIMLQPTAPLRTSEDIDNALIELIKENADGIISVVDVDNWHPMKMKVIRDGLMFDFHPPATENPPRQTLPKVYMVNGAIYATKRDIFINHSTFHGEKCLPFIMPDERSVNIDKKVDLILAEYYLRKL